MRPTVETIIKQQREFFSTHRTKDVGFRIEQLERLKTAILAHENSINKALYEDLHKSAMETYTTEIGLCLAEITYVLRHLASWARPKKVKGPSLLPLTESFVHNEPYGVVLIIAPWNYPLQLTIAPLIGAMAAGNCAILKPSEISSHTSQLIQGMIDDYFKNNYVAVIQGGAEVAQQLLQHKLDYIFYTGGGAVGKIVMKAAAKHLTPVTLELGGKSPCIVDKEIDVEKTAHRITWGKFLNAGQTCVAPDYLMLHKSIKENLIDRIKKAIVDFYGEDAKQSKDYGRMINQRHFARLSTYIEDGDVIFGGETDSKELYIAPTLMDNVSPEAKVMQEEIFGPILPIIEYSDISEAIEFINNRPKPLALYLFSNDRKIQKKVLRETSSGGVCINDTVVHFTSTELPYGGVGASGFGKYHGKASYELLSNKKGVMKQTVLSDLALRYPPYKTATLELIRTALR
jgi:aldehyde dehydrogenase (NAD+)